MKFWNNPKQSASNRVTIPKMIRNTKITQPIISYNQNNCDEVVNDAAELNVSIDVRSPHRDYKQANSSSNTSEVTNLHPSAPKDFGCEVTYEDGIDKDIRDLERRLESELEEHEKLWSPDEETPLSKT